MKKPGLILARNIGETIHIGDNVIITVIDIKGKQAKIHIACDRSVEVHRGEVYDRIQAEKQSTQGE